MLHVYKAQSTLNTILYIIYVYIFLPTKKIVKYVTLEKHYFGAIIF